MFIEDIKRVQDLIVDKVSEDVRSSGNFRKMTYAQLSEEIDAWAFRDKYLDKGNFIEEQ